MYLVAVVGPGSELHVTVLVVKGEPSDVYLACALEDARRDVQATAVMRDHHVCLVRPVETLIRTNVSYHTSINYPRQVVNRDRFAAGLIARLFNHRVMEQERHWFLLLPARSRTKDINRRRTRMSRLCRR